MQRETVRDSSVYNGLLVRITTETKREHGTGRRGDRLEE